jgi:hypothetical protein
MRFASLVMVVLTVVPACGDGGSNVSKDAAIDAPVDMLIDVPMPPANIHRFVIDKVQVPTNNNEALMFGLDLDGDQAVDNQFGQVLVALMGQGFDTQSVVDQAVDRGQLLVLAELDAMSLADGPATYAHYAGANPMPAACAGASDMVCRRHLAGTATFDAAATPRNPPLAGTFVAGTFDGGSGTLHMPLALALGGDMPIGVTLIGARVRLGMASDARLGSGVVAGAMTTTEVETKIYPQLQANANAAIMADCTMLSSPPDCGCAAGSTGRTLRGLFDTNPADCNVSIQEIRDNTLIQTLFAPDVSIGGVDALSVGLSVTAVHAGYVP